MLPQADPPAKSIFKKPAFYSSAVLIIAIFIVAWILFSRWEENRTIDNRAKKERTQKQLEQDRIALEMLGGKELAIQNFYATPGEIRRGQTVQLCYGVANAKTVTLEPQPNLVWPSYSRCVDVTPTKSTVYTLAIADAAGHIKIQTLEVKVR
jgi:hypothetical protein